MRALLRRRRPLLMLPPPRPEAPAPEPPPAAPPGFDAAVFIEAAEERNGRLAQRLRESVQASLLVAATRFDEAMRLAATDPELSASLHAEAARSLEAVRDRELRAISQELHPALVRLGLPAALKALQKDIADVIDVSLDVDPEADRVEDTPGGHTLPHGLRMALYRFALECVQGCALAGAGGCTISLQRAGASLILEVRAEGVAAFEPDALRVAIAALAVFGAAGRVDGDEGAITAVATLHAPVGDRSSASESGVPPYTPTT
jgi:signal transduction histidine kinase